MGSKGPLRVVTPEDWLKRTSLTFSKRSPSTLRVDAAYREFYAAPTSPVKVGALKDALDAYLLEKGNDWSRVDRDKESGGLMKYIYELVVEGSGSRVVPEANGGAPEFATFHTRGTACCCTCSATPRST